MRLEGDRYHYIYIYSCFSDIDWMRRWTSSHNEYFSHLGNIADLPRVSEPSSRPLPVFLSL